jgi:hypothetical protein
MKLACTLIFAFLLSGFAAEKKEEPNFSQR